jgi:hypothetical protein
MKTKKELEEYLNRLLGESKILLQSIVTFMDNFAEESETQSNPQQIELDKLFQMREEAVSLVKRISEKLEKLVIIQK